MAENRGETQDSKWLGYFISNEENPIEYDRFKDLVSRWYSDLTIQDFKFIELDDFLRFIPIEAVGPDSFCIQRKIEDLARHRGMASVLWKRYIAPKIQGE
jgi:hypothetical protein